MNRSLLHLLAFSAAAAGCATAPTAQRLYPTGAREIPWDAQRLLSWHDFRGPVDGAAPSERVAMTAATLRWRYEYALERDGASCRYWINNVTTEAVFNPADSWVKPGYDTAAVLRHEQGHFDLTQIFKRQLDAQTLELVGQPNACSGRSMEAATASAERGAAERMQRVFDVVWASYLAAQQLYDGRTQHGTREAAQLQWSESIGGALRSGHWQSPP